MPRQKRALSTVNPNIAAEEPSSSNRKRQKSTMSTVSSENAASRSGVQSQFSGGAETNVAAAPAFLPVARPDWDEAAEWEDEDDDESESSDKGQEEEEENTDTTETHQNQDKSVPDLNSPDWPWVLSLAAQDKYNYLKKQAENRDQDIQDVWMYNDFSAYGVNEVVDNWLKDFNKEVSRRVQSPYAVWAELEAISWFLQLDYTQIWFQGDDSHGFAETLALVGKALLTGIEILRKNQIFNPYKPEEAESSGIRNIPLILALFVKFANTWLSIGGDHYGETKWVSKVGKVARENGIDITGPYNFQEIAEELLQPEDPNEEKNRPRQKKKVVRFSNGTWGVPKIVEIYSDEDELAIRDNGDYSLKGWKAAFKEYSQKHGKGPGNTIGGSSYDITKLSKAERKQHRLSGF